MIARASAICACVTLFSCVYAALARMTGEAWGLGFITVILFIFSAIVADSEL